MTPGRFIAVVGPSGVGKDSLMDGLLAQIPALQRVRRVITRAPELGGEDYEAVSPARFEDMARAGAFSLHWGAHGLHYGIPAEVEAPLRAGVDCLANLSRGALLEADAAFPALVVLNVTASPEILAERLRGRGRETAEEITRRLAQAGRPLPDGLNVIRIQNDGALADAVSAAAQALYPERVAP